MITLTDYQSYQNYFKAIAEDHKDLDPTEPFIHGDDDVAGSKSRSWTGKKLWLEQPQNGQLLDSNADNLLTQRPCTLFVGGAAGSKGFQAEHDFYNLCENIVEDIIGKLRKDYVEGLIVFDFPSIRYGRAEMEMGATKIIGCRMDWTYKDPSGFPYTAAKWKSED